MVAGHNGHVKIPNVLDRVVEVFNSENGFAIVQSNLLIDMKSLFDIRLYLMPDEVTLLTRLIKDFRPF